MEVFDRFIPYFLFVMHIHPCIYVVPIFLRMAYVALLGDFFLRTKLISINIGAEPALKRMHAC